MKVVSKVSRRSQLRWKFIRVLFTRCSQNFITQSTREISPGKNLMLSALHEVARELRTRARANFCQEFFESRAAGVVKKKCKRRTTWRRRQRDEDSRDQFTVTANTIFSFHDTRGNDPARIKDVKKPSNCGKGYALKNRIFRY